MAEEFAFLIDPADLPLYGLAQSFLDEFDLEMVKAKCREVTAECLGRMKPTVVPPLVKWGADVRGAAAAIIVYELKSMVGLAPTDAVAGDSNLLVRATAKREWFDKIGKGEIEATGLVDSRPGGDQDAILLDPISDPLRGYQCP